MRLALVFSLAIFAGCKSYGKFWDISDGFSFSPAAGPVGTVVTISSTQFDLATLSSASLSGTACQIIATGSATAQVMIMPGSGSGSFTLTNGTGSATTLAAFSVTRASGNFVQQGNKTVGSGNTGNSGQGYALALNANGDSLILGGYTDNSFFGASWAFSRSGSAWSQSGNKLLGSGSIGVTPRQGLGVALSADGQTAFVGGYTDNSTVGAIWVFIKSAGIWIQQGSKLIGTGGVGAQNQGYALACSADGNTLIFGGYSDNTNVGAAWIFTRSNGVWSQQGSKLVGSGGSGTQYQGYAIALSADGNTAAIGGYGDSANQGAVWVFTRTGSAWTQQGGKLVGTGGSATANQGYAVALSADGNFLLSGATNDSAGIGATWVFARSGSSWSQQGAKLVGSGNIGNSNQGAAIAVNADASLAIIGANADNTNAGATWIFSRTGTSWIQLGTKLVGTGATGNAQQGIAVTMSADGQYAGLGGYQDNAGVGAAWIFGP